LGMPIGEEKVNLLLAQVGIESSEVLLEGALQMAVVLGHRQFRQTDDVTGPSFEFSPDLDLLPQSLRFLGEALRSRGLLPDFGAVGGCATSSGRTGLATVAAFVRSVLPAGLFFAAIAGNPTRSCPG